MNVVKEINRINQKELDLGLNGASWHDEYKDSAYIFTGGLHTDMTEGDVITIFSQYGEIMDINMPRDKETGKPKGFAFLMYEDQRSTVLSVDNLNGATVLGRTLRVDHVKDYKQPRIKNEDGEWAEPEEQSMNAKPEIVEGSEPESESSASTGASIDPEDPMRDFLIAQRREAKAKKLKRKNKHKDETPEQRRARKARKKEKKEKRLKSAGVKGVEELLEILTKRGGDSGAERISERNGRLEHSSSRNRKSDSPSRRERGNSRDRSPHRSGERKDRHRDEDEGRDYRDKWSRRYED